MLKTIFLGTPALAVPFLERLNKKSKIAAVVTSPDQPAGRGYELKAPEVKVAAQKLSLPIFQPDTLKTPEVADQIQSYAADVGIVVAYGKLLPKAILSIPKYGFVNVHFSLLPKYRGAAPIQWALLNGETQTGVTLFKLDEGMDTGPVLLQEKIAIAPEDDAESLRRKLGELGVQALEEVLGCLSGGQVLLKPQAGTSSLAPMLKKADGLIQWGKPAGAIINQLRGLTPWPGVHFGGLKILKMKAVEDRSTAEPGTVIHLAPQEGPVVKCGSDALLLLEVQPEGKKAMSAWSWWQGSRLKQGDKLR